MLGIILYCYYSNVSGTTPVLTLVTYHPRAVVPLVGHVLLDECLVDLRCYSARALRNKPHGPGKLQPPSLPARRVLGASGCTAPPRKTLTVRPQVTRTSSGLESSYASG